MFTEWFYAITGMYCLLDLYVGEAATTVVIVVLKETANYSSLRICLRFV